LPDDLESRSQFDRLSQELVAAAKRLSHGGLQTSDGGNLSVRAPDGQAMLIKPSGAGFDEFEAEDLVLCGLDGGKISGKGQPSKESRLHGAVYQAFPALAAIVHCHSPFATAWSSVRGDLPASTYHAAVKLGQAVASIDTGGYSVEPVFFPRIIEAFSLRQSPTAILLAKHGQLAVGSSLAEAVRRAELVEETAKIAFIGAALADFPL
jgi:L-ribulose-5-phosphate 4-epimerase